MKENVTSSEFIGQRIKEIVDENIVAERELYINKLEQDLTFTKSELSRLSKAISILQNEKSELQKMLQNEAKEKEIMKIEQQKEKSYFEEQIKKLNKDLQAANSQFEKIVRSTQDEAREITAQHQENYASIKRENMLLAQKLEDALKELQATRIENEDTYKAIERGKREYKLLEDEYKNLSNEIQKIKDSLKKSEEEAKNLKALNFECSLRMKQMEEEKKRAEEASKKAEKEKEELVEKFNTYGDQLQKSNTETMEAVLAKQKTKREKLQKKIVELKAIIGKLEEDVSQHKKIINDIKTTYERTINQLHEDMKRIKDEWEHKVYEQDLENQRKLAEEQSKTALQISQLQEEYQQALETKLAEIQADAQNQIQKTKSTHVEMKTIFEEKMKEMEKGFIPLSKHEEMLEEERKKGRENLQKEISLIKEEFDKEISNQLKEADSIRGKEIEQVTSMHKKINSELEEALQKTKKEYMETQEKLEQFESEKENLEESIHILEKEHKKLTSDLESALHKIADLETEVDNEKRTKRELEIQLKTTKENSNGLLEKYEKANNLNMKLGTELEALKHKVSDLEEEKETETRKNKGLQSEKDVLTEMVRRLEDDKKVLNGKLQKQIEDLTNESQSLHENTMQIRQRESEKLENEIKNHMTTKNLLIQAEGKVRELEDEISQISTKLKENEYKKAELEDLLGNMKSKNYEFETKIELMENELEKINQQYNSLMKAHENLKSNFQNKFIEIIYGLKEELQNLKGMALNQIAQLQKELCKKLERTILMEKKCEVQWEKKAQEKIQKEKDLLREELQKTIESKEKEYAENSMNVDSKYDVMIKEKNAEIKQFQGLCEEVENKNKTLLRDLTDLQNKIKSHEVEKQKLEKDNEKLRKEVRSNNEMLDNLKNEVKDKTSKLKVDAENAMVVAQNEIENKYKKQLSSLQKEVETLKIESGKELRTVLGDLGNLKLQYQYEAEQTAQSFDQSLGQIEYSLKLEKDKSEKYKNEAERLQSEIEQAKEEHKSELYQLETKMKHLNQSLMSDTEKYKKIKKEKSEEVDNLSKKIRELTAELTLKNEVITEMSNESQSQRQQLKELKMSLELQESNNEKKESDYAKLVSKKEKEIEDLHRLLSKSYHSASSSMDKVKLASKLESETRELAKKVKEASVMKSYKGMPPAIPTSGIRGSVDTSKSSDESRNMKSPLSMSHLMGASPNNQNSNKK